MFNYCIQQHSGSKQQRGAALVVSLVILVAMTMLGITSMKSTTTELSMVGNLRESALSFQAAEAGLSGAEAIFLAGDTPPKMIAEVDPDPDYLNQTTWENDVYTNPVTTSLANITIALRPRYISKYLGEWDPDRNVSSLDPGFSGYGQASNATRVGFFRITARGYGQTGNTSRTVQTFFGRRQN